MHELASNKQWEELRWFLDRTTDKELRYKPKLSQSCFGMQTVNCLSAYMSKTEMFEHCFPEAYKEGIKPTIASVESATALNECEVVKISWDTLDDEERAEKIWEQIMQTMPLVGILVEKITNEEGPDGKIRFASMVRDIFSRLMPNDLKNPLVDLYKPYAFYKKDVRGYKKAIELMLMDAFPEVYEEDEE